MLLLKRSELEKVLRMQDTVESIEEAFREHQLGRSLTPLRMHIELDRVEGVYLLMPSYMDESTLFGAKLLSVYPQNREKDLPTISSLYVLSDAADGSFLSIMDGSYLTGMRTGAASAVAARYLARQDAVVHGILGAGVQAMFQAEAIHTVRPSEKILVHDLNHEAAQAFAVRARERLGIPVIVANSTEEVAGQADILTTVTTSSNPVVKATELKKGCHVNAVGAFKPTMREIGYDTLSCARVVVDTYEGCMKEAGDIIIPILNGLYDRECIHAELGELVLGQKQGRVSDSQFTVFKSVGVAFEDLVTSMLAYKAASQQNIGTTLSFSD